MYDWGEMDVYVYGIFRGVPFLGSLGKVRAFLSECVFLPFAMGMGVVRCRGTTGITFVFAHNYSISFCFWSSRSRSYRRKAREGVLADMYDRYLDSFGFIRV